MPAKKQDFECKTCFECGNIIIHKIKRDIKNNKPEVGYSSEE